MSASSMTPQSEGLARSPRTPNGAAPPPASAPPDGTGWTDKVRKWPWWVSFLVVLLANYFLVNVLFPSEPPRVPISYTFFKEQVVADNVAEINSRGDTIQGSFRGAVSYQPDGAASATMASAFSTVQPQFADPGLETLLNQHGVRINASSLDQPRDPLLTLLISFGPTILLIGGFMWLSSKYGSQIGGGMFGMGKSQAKRYDETGGAKKITFADVAGIDEAKAELVEVVDFLRHPDKYTRLGGTVPKGVLLVGSPGTGKTLLARATAGEAGVPFFSMGASEFVEMIVGVGASRVRDLFKQAREAAPSIVFIDELDAIGRARGGGVAYGANSEQEQTLNQILSEMDGFTGREGVIVLAATNRPDVLDPALLRAGRFDRRVTVAAPEKNGREAILKVHTRGVPLGADVDLRELASATPGLVGADLRNLVNEAALLAARRQQDEVRRRDFADALEKLVLGPARAMLMNPEEKRRVAYHEGGHTILGLVVPGADSVNRVTIVPRGQALGVTYQQPEDDRHNYDEAYLRARIIGAMGGRAAEEVVYGGRTTGAENDMQQATNMARQMVTRWGMSDKIGPMSLGGQDNPYLAGDVGGGVGGKPYSEGFAQLVDSETQRILEENYAAAMQLLTLNRSALDALATALMEHETLDRDEILQVTGLYRAPRSADEHRDGQVPALAVAV
jgi:cell division protease FtsH